MYDQQRRQQARAIYEARGLDAAATETGIGRSTIHRWAVAGQWDSPSQQTGQRENPDQRLHPVAPSVSRAEPLKKGEASQSPVPTGGNGGLHRPAVAVDPAQAYAAEAIAMLQAAMEARSQGKAREAKEFMLAAAIATDKALKLGARVAGAQPQTPRERANATWALLVKLWGMLEQAAMDDPGLVRGFCELALGMVDRAEQAKARGEQLVPLTWELHLLHPDPGYVARVQRMLAERDRGGA